MNHPESASTPVRWLSGLWKYYRGYTRTAAHAAATAALTGFGLLAFVDPLFVALAILSYLVPPVALYGLGADVGDRAGTPAREPDRAAASSGSVGRRDADSDGDDGDADSDGDDGDTDR